MSIGNGNANATNIDYTIKVRPSMSITIPNPTVSLQLNPSSGAFSSQDLNITVGTNNESGYKMIVTATSTDLVASNTGGSGGTGTGNDAVIETLPTKTGGYSESEFLANYWGYKKSINGGTATNYLPFETNTELRNVNSKVNSDTTTMTFASKIDYTKPAGVYDTTLSFIIVANPSVFPLDITYLQDFASMSAVERASVVAQMSPDTNYTLLDKRDNQEYTIARLTGSRANSGYDQVWMTKNLNLAGGTQLNSTTTDMPDNYTIPTTYNDSPTGFGANNTLPASEVKNADDNNLQNSSGFSSDTTAYVYNSNRTDCSSPGCYSYYSWTAATLGSGLSESGDGTDVTTASICPKGWRLPTSGNRTSSSANNWKKGDFYKMATTYGANLESDYNQSSGKFYNNAGPSTTVPNFLLAGYYNSGSFDRGGLRGYYWSSSSGSSTSVYYLLFNPNFVNSASNSSRSYGFSVRCVLNDPVSDLLSELESGSMTMQDFANMPEVTKNNLVNAMTANTNYTVKDARDNQNYTIARLTGTVANSGYSQVWMTKNLNLAGGTQLNSSNTDMPAGYTLPTANGFGANNTLPASVSGTSSEDYSSDTTAYVTNSGSTTCGSNSPCYSYYSWTTATLGSGLSESSDGTDVTAASICPAGWRLPTSGNQNLSSTNNWKKGDFYKLATAYGASLESNFYQISDTFYNNAGPNTTVPNFLLAGRYISGSFYDGGSYGYYWLSSSRSSTDAYNLNFSSSSVDSANSNSRRGGFGIRCVLK